MKNKLHLDKLYNEISNCGISCYNLVKTRDVAICFNVIEIPDQDVSMLTVSIMKDRKRSASLDGCTFAGIMHKIEVLLDTIRENNNYQYSFNDKLFNSVYDILPKFWYNHLNCHRVFFIPNDCVTSLVENLSSLSFIHKLSHSQSFVVKEKVLNEVSIYVNTSSHSMKITQIVF